MSKVNFQFLCIFVEKTKLQSPKSLHLLISLTFNQVYQRCDGMLTFISIIEMEVSVNSSIDGYLQKPVKNENDHKKSIHVLVLLNIVLLKLQIE